MNIYVNGRFHAHRVTGVQRVAHEITRRLKGNVEICQPKRRLLGWQGHLWEQTSLPRQCRDGVLWSPCASGPITNARHVVTFHDLFAVDSPQWYQPAYASWYAYSLGKLARTAKHIIAVSEYTKRRLIARFAVDEAKITVVHNGVDAAFFAASPVPHPALRLPSPRYLLSVGSLEPRKNFKSLLVAWQNVVHELPKDLWLVYPAPAIRTCIGAQAWRNFPTSPSERLRPRRVPAGSIRREPWIYLPVASRRFWTTSAGSHGLWCAGFDIEHHGAS